MFTKETRSAEQLRQMIQDAVDPQGEYLRVRVGPKAAPGATWIMTLGGSTIPLELFSKATQLAEALQAQFDLAEQDEP